MDGSCREVDDSSDNGSVGSNFQDDLDGLSDGTSEDFDDGLSSMGEELANSGENMQHHEDVVPSQEPSPNRYLGVSGDNKSEYRYSKLKEDTNFRLLVLKANDNSQYDTIECDLREENLKDDTCPEYTALSYRWGNPTKTHRVYIRDNILRITANLHEALLSLRHPSKDRLLWVDGICINQSGMVLDDTQAEQEDTRWVPCKGKLDEKTIQVRQMGEIYEKASSVTIWLGPSKLEEGQLFQFLEGCTGSNDSLVYLRRRRDHWEHSPRMQEVNESLQDLLRHDWFNRVWIVQEVARSRSAEIKRGEYSVAANISAQLPELLGLKIEHHCQRILNIMPGPRDLQPSNDTFRDAGGLWIRQHLRTLLNDFRHCESTQPEDKIYALLGLSIEQQQKDKALALDYNKGERRIVHDTIVTLYPGFPPDELPYWSLAEFWVHLDSLESSLLVWAVEESQIALLKSLLQLKNPGISTTFDAQQLQELFFTALQSGGADVVAVLLQARCVDVNARSKAGCTPLDIALRNDCSEAVAALLSEHDIDTRDKRLRERLLTWWASNPAYTSSSKESDVAFENALIQVGLERLRVDANNPLLEQVEVKAPTEVDAGKLKCYADSRSLMQAVLENDAKAVKSLLRMRLLLRLEGVAVGWKDEDGRTPFSYAMGAGVSLAITGMLLSADKTNIDSRDSTGRTPLSYAAETGDSNKVGMLLDTDKVNVDSRDSVGRTPLSYAAESGDYGKVEMLLKTEKVNVDSRDSVGRTPLSYAAVSGNDNTVEVLLLRKADVYTQDNTGRTPLWWAASTRD